MPIESPGAAPIKPSRLPCHPTARACFTTPAREPPCKAHQVYGCVVCRGLLNISPPRRRPSPPRVTTPAAPRLNRAILGATFAKVDQNGDGRVQLHELARSVAENDALAQLLGLPPGLLKTDPGNSRLLKPDPGNSRLLLILCEWIRA